VLYLLLLLALQEVQVLAHAGLRGVLGRVLVLLPQCVGVCICIRTRGDLQQQRRLRGTANGGRCKDSRRPSARASKLTVASHAAGLPVQDLSTTALLFA
jgi:hypothetical protein